MLRERLGRLHLALWLIGVHLTFVPMHRLGRSGKPRRLYTHPDGMGCAAGNQLATIGAYVLALSVTTRLGNLGHSRRRGALAGPDPWGGDTLEWGTASPILPLLAASAVSVRFIRLVWSPWAVVWGGLLPVPCVWWGRPLPARPHGRQRGRPRRPASVRADDGGDRGGAGMSAVTHPERRIVDVSQLPATTFGHRATTWWATIGSMPIEGTTMGVLGARRPAGSAG